MLKQITFVTLLLALNVSALSKDMKELLDKIKKQNESGDKYNVEFNQMITDTIQEMTHEQVWDGENELGDEDRRPEADVVVMDLKMYQETFFGDVK